MQIFGVDIGGSGIKGAPVDLDRGDLADDRFKVLTPHPATPDGVAGCVKQVVDHFGWNGPVGITFPGVVTGGSPLLMGVPSAREEPRAWGRSRELGGGSTIRTAANVDKRWLDIDARALLSERLGGLPVTVLNDADAAGLAEMHFGAGRGRNGTIILLTFGTGIGSALFIDGTLVPNTELGHLQLHGHEAEKHASTRVKDEENLSWEHWAHRVQKYLAHVEMLFSPELFIIGGGISRKAQRFLPLIKGIKAEIVPAELQNNAGIVGAAMRAAERA